MALMLLPASMAPGLAFAQEDLPPPGAGEQADMRQRALGHARHAAANMRQIGLLKVKRELHERCRECASCACLDKRKGLHKHAMSAKYNGKVERVSHQLPGYPKGAKTFSGIQQAISVIDKTIASKERSVANAMEKIEACGYSYDDFKSSVETAAGDPSYFKPHKGNQRGNSRKHADDADA